jgi:uncharacterized protein
MINDHLIVDAVVHCYNWTPENQRINDAGPFSDAGVAFHKQLSPDNAYQLTKEEFSVDWQPDQLEHTLFRETNIDFVCYHGTPIWDYFYDGHIAFDKGVELRERNPGRVLLYAPINPLEGVKVSEDIDKLVDTYQIDGLKLYAAQYYRGRTIQHRLDDTTVGHPLIEKALERGIKSIAVHKALPFGPHRFRAYDVDDVDEVAAMYPEMNFEIVHSGYAFLEETAHLLARFPNVWANLEVTASLVVRSPRRFAEIMGLFLAAGAADRIIYASGCTLVHPKPTIDGILDFSMPTDLIEGYDYPEFTDEIRYNILGANFLRLHGIDQAQLAAKVGADEWRAHQNEGLLEPWSYIRD